MKRLLVSSLGWTAYALLFASCNNECDCTKIQANYDASGTLVYSEVREIRDDCAKVENYTEQDGEGTKEVSIICEFR